MNDSEHCSGAAHCGSSSASAVAARVSNANTTLVFPADADLKQLSGKRIPLTFGPPHPKSRGGHPILVDPDAEVITLETFRRLRVKLGAWIETDDPARVREALGAAENEPGLVVATFRRTIELA